MDNNTTTTLDGDKLPDTVKSTRSWGDISHDQYMETCVTTYGINWSQDQFPEGCKCTSSYFCDVCYAVIQKTKSKK